MSSDRQNTPDAEGKGQWDCVSVALLKWNYRKNLKISILVIGIGRSINVNVSGSTDAENERSVLRDGEDRYNKDNRIS